MFTPLEEEQILNLNNRLSHDITISRIDSEHPNNKAFKQFCDGLSHRVPKVKIEQVEDSQGQPPQILIGDGLRYQAVPSGHELQPFLDALIAYESGSADIAEPVKTRLKKNKLPAALTIFIAPQCTFCPTVVRQLIPLPMVDNKLQLTIIDGTLFTELAQTRRIRSVPTILLDDEFRWTGSVPLEELIDAINTRNPVSLGAASLEGILKEGQAGHLAAMMLEANKIFPAFYDVLTHNKWPVRLGAMVVMEEIADKKPDLASEALRPLWDQFQRVSDQIQGDILHIIGEISDPRAVSWLETVMAGNFDREVKEAAAEAMEKCLTRTSRKNGHQGTKQNCL